MRGLRDGEGPGRGAGGRQRRLARSRNDAPSRRSATRPHWCGGRRMDRRARLRCRWAATGANRQHTKDKPRPIGGRREACGAWPGFETTRRAKLAARTASGRAGRAAAGDLSGQQATKAGGPPPTGTHSGPAHKSRRGDRNTRGATSNAGDQVGPRCGDGGNRTPIQTQRPEHQRHHNNRENTRQA